MTLALVLGLVVAAVVLWPVAGRSGIDHLGRSPTDFAGRSGVDHAGRSRTGGARPSPTQSGGGSCTAAAEGSRTAAVGDRSTAAGPSGLRRLAAYPWPRRARTVALETALAELVAAIAAPLRAGVAPSVALVAVEPTCRDDPALGPLLRDLVEAARTGGSVAETWLRHGDVHESGDLRFIGQAWALSERTGAPLADALASGEEVLRARAVGRQRLAGAAAGPRASMAVLCLLPASGPIVGAALGVGPRRLYFSSSLATASLVLGVVLALGAWWWSRRILRRAT